MKWHGYTVYFLGFALLLLLVLTADLDSTLRGDAATGSYDVLLVQQDPIYTYIDRGLNYARVPHKWFMDLAWLPGYLVVSGDCDFTKGRTSRFNPFTGEEGVEGNPTFALARGGLYLFTDDGNHIATYDKCTTHNAGLQNTLCGHDEFCRVGRNVIPVSENEIIADLATSNSEHERPLVRLRVSNTGFQKTGELPGYGNQFTTPRIGVFQYANEKLVGIQGEASEPSMGGILFNTVNIQQGVFSTILRNAQTFALEKTFTGDALVPLASAGNYIAMTTARDKFNTPVDVYEVGADLTLVERLTDENAHIPLSFDTNPSMWKDMKDPLYPERLLVWLKGDQPGVHNLGVYEPGANGFTHIKTIVPDTVPASKQEFILAVAGDYTVTTACVSRQACRLGDYELRVYYNNERLAVEQVTLDRISPQYLNAEISATGELAVVIWPQAVYLYTIPDFDPGERVESPPFAVPPAFAPPDHPDGVQITVGRDGQDLVVTSAADMTHNTGYYLDETWKPFSFGETPWLPGQVTTTLDDVPNEGYVLVYACVDRQCGVGCTNDHCWTIQSYSMT